jgi:putative phosphoesterase
MKIGIISDSHKKIKRNQKAIDFLVSQGAEFFIHAGDIVREENIKALKDSGIPYCAVFGNNDSGLIEVAHNYELYREPHYFKLNNLKFKLMHHPYYLTPDSDIVIFGHTHLHEVQYVNKTLFLNSGEVCARDKSISEVILLEITNSEYIVNYFYRVKKETQWNSIIKRFNRDE